MSAIGVTPFKRHALYAWVPDSRHVSLSRCDGVYLLTYLLPSNLVLSNRVIARARARRIIHAHPAREPSPLQFPHTYASTPSEP